MMKSISSYECIDARCVRGSLQGLFTFQSQGEKRVKTRSTKDMTNTVMIDLFTAGGANSSAIWPLIIGQCPEDFVTITTCKYCGDRRSVALTPAENNPTVGDAVNQEKLIKRTER